LVCGVPTLYVKTMICGVVINSLEVTLILQPAHSDVKISPFRAQKIDHRW